MEDKLKQKLEETELRYHRIFETARDGIILLDYKTGKVTEINPFLEKLIGYSKDKFLGKKFLDIPIFKNAKPLHNYFKILKEKGYIECERLSLEADDGRIIEIEFVCTVYSAGDSKIIQCNIRDVTERNRFEVETETKRILDAETAKNSFIADATHEFRTPLAIIKGNVDLGLRAKQTDYKSARKALRSINKEVYRLSELLQDITSITSNQYNRRSTDRKPDKVVYLHRVDIVGVVRSAVNRCRTLAYKKNIHITMSDSIPEFSMMGDKKYLEKLFMNIINNAILYGKKNGKIVITGSKDDLFFKILVTDNGLGISTKDLPHIFDRFYRADNGLSGNLNGTGLGLAISKWIAESHGGSITVKSSLNKETTFSIILPVNSSPNKS
ncbi:MAG: PAS domain-containing sensor histidine kinase [Parcubacteria group bacterium]